MLALAANKSDLERSRQVRQEEAEVYATSIGAKLFSTSAKLNKGVDRAFLEIALSTSPTPERTRSLHHARTGRAAEDVLQHICGRERKT